MGLSMSRLRVIFSFGCIAFGFSLLAMYAWSVRGGLNFPIEAYWLSFAFVSTPLLSDVFFWHSSPRLRLIYLISFALIIHLQYAVVDSSPFLSSEDAIFDYKLTAQIVASNQWVPGQAVERAVTYSFYPASNFIYATVSLLTGIPLMVVVKYLFVVRALVVPPIIWKWYRNFFSENISYLGTAVLLASPGAILFPHKEALALIFFALSLYALTKIVKTRRRGFLATSFVLAPALIFTHHITTYFFVAVLGSVALVAHFVEHRPDIRPPNQFLLFCFIVFSAWVSFVAYASTLGHAELFSNVLFQVVSIPAVHGETLLQSSVLYEKVIIWSGFVATMLFAGVGFLIYIRNKKLRSIDFVVLSVFLFALLAVTTPFRFIPFPGNLDVSHRAYEFAYFAIGPLVGFSILATTKLPRSALFNMILAIVMILVLVSAPMGGTLSPRNPTAEIANVLTPSALSMNSWMNEFGGNTNVVGDFQIDFLVFVGYGDYLVHTYYGEREVEVYPQVFTDPAVNFTALTDRGLTGPVFVVTYNQMVEIHPSWNQTTITKFDASPYSQRVESNGAFTVYLLRPNATR
jgi:hypothetical protein